MSTIPNTIHSTLRHLGECQRGARAASAKLRATVHPCWRAVIALCLAIAAPLSAQGLTEADAAFMQQHFPDAARDYRAVLANGSAADRKAAALSLAVIDWKIDGDTARAMHDLQPFGTASSALTMMSRARLSDGNVAGARASARGALARATTAQERREAAVALADAVLLPYERSCIDGAPTARMRALAGSDSALRDVMAQLREGIAAEPGHLDASERLLRAAALTGDWPALTLAWKSYYAVGRRVPGGPLVRAESQLDSLARAAPRDKAAHALNALTDSKLFEPAALLAACGPRSSARAEDIIAYARFLRSAVRVTNDYYRTVALGHADTTAWSAALDSAARTLWSSLALGGAYSFDSAAAQIERRFDLIVDRGKTGDVLDLHSGHRVSVENRDAVQYGKRAHLRFSVLDGMISDGYQTWAWDGRAAHGGWASDVEIVQVREGYAEGPLNAWHALTDSATVARNAAAIARDSAADLERARDTSVAYFPSIEARLRRDVRIALRDSLARGGLSGRELELAFVRTYGNDIDESSIFAHEGRHAIDKTLHIADSSAKNLEYQAKLSELAFAPEPRLALAVILGPNTGDDTPHGIADARIMRELLDWMRHHGIGDGATRLPLPLLIPTLTDAQLRAVSRSLDPLAASSAR